MIQFESFERGGRPPCAVCEEMLADATDDNLTPDEILTPAEQARFHAHLATCPRCAQMYLEAERGAGWLTLLKAEQPELQEYRTDLVSRILQQTSGAAALPAALQPVSPTPLHVSAAAWQPMAPVYRMPERTLPFWRRAGQILLEPRLAMTAAMAFFSIGLTLNLTGVQLNQLHATDLNPLNLRRDLYQADAHAVRYYDNLRVVHVLESRVDDLKDRAQGLGQPETTPDQDAPEQRPASSEPARKPEQAPPASKTPGSSRWATPTPARDGRPHLLQTSAAGSPHAGGLA